MATLTLDNRDAILEGVPTKVAKKLSKLTSYLQAGYMHIPGFNAGYWDGRRRLLTMLKDERLKIPMGMAQEVVYILEGRGVELEVVDRRRLPDYSLGLFGNFNFGRLRGYQRNALREATDPRGSLGLHGRGIIKMPPRSGKTFTAAAIVATLDVRALFLVPSKGLLYQTQKALSDDLGVKVGLVGDQIWDPRDITVATIQTLVKLRGKNTKKEPASPRYLELLRRADLVIFDECHHLEAERWRKVMQDSGAPYKIGLSATAFLDHDREVELGVLWLRACTGEILIDISVSDLIEKGFLVPLDVLMYPIRQPDFRRRGWSKRLHRDAIFCNDYRNEKIVEVTADLVRKGRRPIVITNKLEQVGSLTRLLQQTPVRFARVVGQARQATRDRDIKSFQRGQIRALVGTVLGEGIDIPECDAVVVAEGGSDIKTTYQRLRCLTLSSGKRRAVAVDFLDMTHPYFAEHSMERLNIYRSERAFRVRVGH